MSNQNINEGKTIAIISYITWIGTLIAYFMNNSKRNSFSAFHIRQMLGLCLLQIGLGAIGYFLNLGMIGSILQFALFVLWIIGFIGCIKGEEKRIPLLGDLFQDWFKGI
ncbi:MAG: hypothetical protein COB98_01320 [Flavobacteriaceae bacterium]|nr:MAG: hypothetical protein COB98_01320 [Flavobacteriaceae bacterium]